MNGITSITPYSLYNSQGASTVAIRLTTYDGKVYQATIPEGLSRGKNEAKTVPVTQAISFIRNRLVPPLLKKTPESQEELDAFLLHSKAPANATLPLSLCFAKAYNTFPPTYPLKLPKLMMLMFEGGKHGNSSIKTQEFMVIVNRFETGRLLFCQIKRYLQKNKHSVTTGEEGGFSPQTMTDQKVLALLKKMVGQKHQLALDIANNHANFSIRKINSLLMASSVFSIEDPAKEEAGKDWEKIFSYWKSTKQIVADDLTVTDPKRITSGANKLFNAVVIKPNQQSTLTQAKIAANTAKNLGLNIIVSHRGTDTNDAFIADFALSVQADYVKFGGPNRGERIAKYNRLRELVYFSNP